MPSVLPTDIASEAAAPLAGILASMSRAGRDSAAAGLESYGVFCGPGPDATLAEVRVSV